MAMINELHGRELYFVATDEYGVVVERAMDEFGFPSIYLVEMDDGGLVELHEDKLVDAGVLSRTVH